MKSDCPILFYDGDCGFCNKSVQFVLKHNTHKTIHFAPLQGDFTRNFFSDKGLNEPDLSTLYFWDGKQVNSRSTGVLKIVPYLRFPYWFLMIGWLLPRFLRDGIYNFVARRRKSLAKGFCVLPILSERKRFLH